MSDKNNFNYCCNKKNNVEYSLKHNPKPINLLPELRKCIDNLLWYIPGINSVQSEHNYLIDKSDYSEVVFDIILNDMNINYKNDVYVVTGPNKYTSINSNLVKKYENTICTSCQKMIFTRDPMKETNLRAMLRHIRNSIAHGNFTIVDQLAIFKDEKKNNGQIVETAFIKVDIKLLNKILQKVVSNDGFTLEKIIARVFYNLGYLVDMGGVVGFLKPDMIVEKNNSRYAIQIKLTKKKRLGCNDSIVEQLIAGLEKVKKENIIPVFVFDENIVTDKCKSLMRDQGIIILDKSNIRALATKSVTII